jgi:hypothetical protein
MSFNQLINWLNEYMIIAGRQQVVRIFGDMRPSSNPALSFFGQPRAWGILNLRA